MSPVLRADRCKTGLINPQFSDNILTAIQCYFAGGDIRNEKEDFHALPGKAEIEAILKGSGLFIYRYVYYDKKSFCKKCLENRHTCLLRELYLFTKLYHSLYFIFLLHMKYRKTQVQLYT